MNKVHLKGLDGLRAIAALLVVVGHVELVKKLFNFHNVYEGGGPFFLYLGNLSVTFFFVLSGFLITFLLLKEREKTSTININFFYLKRVLRIWPVYYLLFLVGFILLPNMAYSFFLIPEVPAGKDYWTGFLCNFFLAPNFTTHNNPIAFQSWSIGVEEQFYIFWPLLIRKIKPLKKLSLVMLSIVIGLYFLRSLVLLKAVLNIDFTFIENINFFLGRSRFDNMALGGMLAIVYFKRPNYKFNFIIKLLIMFFLAFMLIKNFSIGYGLDNILAAIIFCFIIYWVINSEHIWVLDNKVMKYLGKISYGLYMYHILGNIIVINLLHLINPFFKGDTFVENLVLYSFSLVLTIFISHLSYQFIESRILTFKEKYERSSNTGYK